MTVVRDAGILKPFALIIGAIGRARKIGNLYIAALTLPNAQYTFTHN